MKLLVLFLLPFVALSQHTWNVVSDFPPSNHLKSITVRHDDTLFGVCMDDTSQFLVKSGDGLTWQGVGPPTPRIESVVMAHNNKLFLTGKTVSVSTDGGHNWSLVNVGNNSVSNGPMTSMLNGDLYIGARFGTFAKYLYKSVDDGVTWTSMIIQGVSEKSGYLKDLINVRGNLCATFWALESIESGLYVSIDSGKTFNKALINIGGSGFFRNTGFALGEDGDVYLFGSPSQVGQVYIYKSIDKGLTWSAITHTGFSNFWTEGAVAKTNNYFFVAGTRVDSSHIGTLFRSETITGLTEKDSSIEQILWPNPAAERIYVRTFNNIVVKGFQVTDIQGCIRISGPGQPQMIDIGELSRGLYVLQLKSASGQILSQRFVVH